MDISLLKEPTADGLAGTALEQHVDELAALVLDLSEGGSIGLRLDHPCRLPLQEQV